MRCAALERTELDRAGLAAHLAADEIRQVRRRAGELLVAERVHIVGAAAGLAHIGAVRQADALGDGDEHGVLVLEQAAHLRQERLDVKGHFGQIDEIDALAVLALGQRGRAGEPARVAAHDLDDRDQLLLVGEAVAVADDLLDGGGDVLRRAAVARCVVGQGEVVVDRLGHAEEALRLAGEQRVVGELLDGVHRVVAADVDEALDVELVENVEDLDVDVLILVDGGQLVAAGAQEGGRGALEDLDVQLVLDIVGQIDVLLIEQALDAVAHAVDLVEAAIHGRLEHARQAGVDDSRRAAGLSYDDVAFHVWGTSQSD